ncbi:DUF1996 domain-containing protein [Streptomyces spongiicola]|uniref:DUF1996 domain-containing protein n=1 Tax=Streptomyces spongiicola TaxID=1690221 RepID=A0A388SWK3_9ACTN|nr:DUF1996 domain-containing protein [Streptomyces spongiicola]GBP99354.1 DUF1996 domain-containing protein [Streptomyces spongiicola]
MLGGGGLIAVNTYASAGEGWGKSQDRTLGAGASASTIKCPEAANGLSEVPDAARREVDRELAAMDSQITEAYKRFAEQREQVAQDPGFAENAVLGPLEDKRTASLDRIATAIGRVGDRPKGLESMAACELKQDEADDGGNQGGNGQGQDGGQNDGGQDDGGQGGGGGGQAGNGPVQADFVDIKSVKPNAGDPRNRRGVSRGVFKTSCGVNENGKFNPDNVIVAPGVANGAHHMHDYIGNQANDAFASDDDLAAGETTCVNQGDRSSYFWPVLRLQNGQQEDDADADGGGKDQNVGEIQTPSQVTMDFVGNPRSKVTAMPRLLRIITGDAKAFVNGDANANASWSCTGFENRQLKDKYPICPQGSQVVRTFKFQSCWDGQNTDSANHRTHVAFAQANGACPNGFRAIPQLVQRIVYDVPPPVFGGANPSVFAVDSFPEQLHKPITDHGDFINVFDENLMEELVSCINEGRECGPDDAGAPPADDGGNGGNGDGGNGEGDGGNAGNGGNGGNGDGGNAGNGDGGNGGDNEENPGDPAPPNEGAAGGQEAPGAPGGDGEPGAAAGAGQDSGQDGAGQDSGQNGEGQNGSGPADNGAADNGSGDNGAADNGNGDPKAPDGGGEVKNGEVLANSSAGSSAGSSTGSSAGTNDSAQTGAGDGEPAAQPTEAAAGNAAEPNGGGSPLAGSQGGGLAETGAQLWPSAAGAVLLVAGVLLLRTRRPQSAAARRR